MSNNLKEFFCLVLAIVAIMIILGACTPEYSASNRNCSYFVPDPIAAKEGEFQWLQLTDKQCNVFRDRNSHYIYYTVDDVQYSTHLFIKCKSR